MRKRMLIPALLLLAGLLAGCGAGNGGSAPSADDAPSVAQTPGPDVQGADLAGQVDTEEEDRPLELGSYVFLFRASICGEIYHFPMMYGDLEEKGWKQVGEAEVLGAHYYEYIDFANADGQTLSVALYNKAGSEVSIRDTIVEGFRYRYSEDPNGELSLLLPAQIRPGESTAEAAVAAYGEPTQILGGAGDTRDMELRYDLDDHSYLHLTFSDGVLDGVDYVCIPLAPEGYDEGKLTVDGDTPDYVRSYRAPKKQGSSLFDYTVEFGGDLYRLNCPLKAFLDNGWELTESRGGRVAGNDYAMVSIERDDSVFDLVVYNEDKNRQLLENCMVENLYLYDYYYGEEMQASLAKGITFGTSLREVTALLDADGVAYRSESDENGLYLYAEDPENASNGYTFYFREERIISMDVVHLY